jgi:hypothetical protein
VGGDNRHARDEQNVHLAVRGAVPGGAWFPLPLSGEGRAVFPHTAY